MITTEKRTRDWIAFANGDRRIWEAGRTEEEAAGKLVLRLQKEAAQPARSEAGDEQADAGGTCPKCGSVGYVMLMDGNMYCNVCKTPRR